MCERTFAHVLPKSNRTLFASNAPHHQNAFRCRSRNERRTVSRFKLQLHVYWSMVIGCDWGVARLRLTPIEINSKSLSKQQKHILFVKGFAVHRMWSNSAWNVTGIIMLEMTVRIGALAQMKWYGRMQRSKKSQQIKFEFALKLVDTLGRRGEQSEFIHCEIESKLCRSPSRPNSIWMQHKLRHAPLIVLNAHSVQCSHRSFLFKSTHCMTMR